MDGYEEIDGTAYYNGIEIDGKHKPSDYPSRLAAEEAGRFASKTDEELVDALYHDGKIPVRMGIASKKELYELGNESMPEFQGFVENLAKEIGLPAEKITLRENLKWEGRAAVKVGEDYAGDWGSVLDLNGAMLIVDTVDQIAEARRIVNTKYKRTSANQKDFASDYGYKDYKLSARMSNGFIGEVQIIQKDIYWMKEKLCHAIYNEGRKLEKYLKLKNESRYTKLFGAPLMDAISKLKAALAEWSSDAYSHSKEIQDSQYDIEGSLAEWSSDAYSHSKEIQDSQYDIEGSLAKRSAVSLEITELSNQLRPNIAASFSEGFDSYITPLDSLTTQTSPVSESLLNGTSQISKYLTDIENTSSNANIAQPKQEVNISLLQQEDSWIWASLFCLFLKS